MDLSLYFIFSVHRPYRIPISDRAAFMVVLPPILGIFLFFLVSNWYVYLFCGISVLAGFAVVKIGKNAHFFGHSVAQNFDEHSHGRDALWDKIISRKTEIKIYIFLKIPRKFTLYIFAIAPIVSLPIYPMLSSSYFVPLSNNHNVFDPKIISVVVCLTQY